MVDPNKPIEDMTTSELQEYTSNLITIESALLHDIQPIPINTLKNNIDIVSDAIKNLYSSTSVVEFSHRMEDFEGSIKDTNLNLVYTNQNIAHYIGKLGNTSQLANELHGRVNNIESAHVNNYNASVVVNSENNTNPAGTFLTAVETIPSLTNVQLGDLTSNAYYQLTATKVNGVNTYPIATCPEGFTGALNENNLQSACLDDSMNAATTNNPVAFKDEYLEFTVIGDNLHVADID